MAKHYSGFYTGEAVEITGIPYRTIDHWARTGFISPSISEARGKGRTRLYSFEDLLALRVARDLRKKGVSVQALRKVIVRLREGGLHRPLTDAPLLVIGKDVAVAKDLGEIQSMLSRPGQLYLTPTMIFDIRKPMAEIKRKIARMRVA